MILAALLHQAALELAIQSAVMYVNSVRPLVALQVAEPAPFAPFATDMGRPQVQREPRTIQLGCHYEYRYQWFCRPDGCQWVYHYVWVCN